MSPVGLRRSVHCHFDQAEPDSEATTNAIPSTTFPGGTAMEARLGPCAMAMVLLHGSDRQHV